MLLWMYPNLGRVYLCQRLTQKTSHYSSLSTTLKVDQTLHYVAALILPKWVKRKDVFMALTKMNISIKFWMRQAEFWTSANFIPNVVVIPLKWRFQLHFQMKLRNLIVFLRQLRELCTNWFTA